MTEANVGERPCSSTPLTLGRSELVARIHDVDEHGGRLVDSDHVKGGGKKSSARQSMRLRSFPLFVGPFMIAFNHGVPLGRRLSTSALNKYKLESQFSSVELSPKQHVMDWISIASVAGLGTMRRASESELTVLVKPQSPSHQFVTMVRWPSPFVPMLWAMRWRHPVSGSLAGHV